MSAPVSSSDCWPARSRSWRPSRLPSRPSPRRPWSCHRRATSSGSRRTVRTSAITLGDWYTSGVAGGGAGYHYVQFQVPCGWPAATPDLVDLFSPEENRVAGATPTHEEPNGNYDSTQFELYGPGATVGPGFANPAPGAGIAGTRDHVPAGSGRRRGSLGAVRHAERSGRVRLLRRALAGAHGRSRRTRAAPATTRTAGSSGSAPTTTPTPTTRRRRTTTTPTASRARTTS